MSEQKFTKSFVVEAPSIRRKDIARVTQLSRKEALSLTNKDMEKIAKKMGEAYADNGWAIDLQAIAEDIN